MPIDEYENELYQKAIRLAPAYAKLIPKRLALHFLKCGFLAGYSAKAETTKHKNSVDKLLEVRDAIVRVKNCLEFANAEEEKIH